ncbi:hypothetical protein F4804DRAFT_331888 [Jackrogersella minutella]|nr:hypothetical protein F4804DRAFT_331888 [Jackrogersella minutella]
MTSALRLASLSYYAIASVNASLLAWSGSRSDAGNWGPARHTDADAAAANINPVGTWTPKPTAPPRANPFDLELRRRQQTTTAPESTCGYPIGNLSDPAITCNEGSYCYENVSAGAAGCCNSKTHRDCKVPTTCIETVPASYVPDSRTLLCNGLAFPHCVTYLYNATFFENFYGVSFLACGKEAVASTIATSPLPGWSPTSDISTPPASSTDGGQSSPVTVTVFPSSSPSSSTAPAASESHSSTSRTGAIAGGVIGGVAGLALIVAAIFLLLRYRRRKAAEGKEMEGSPPYPGRDYGVSSVYPGGLPEPQYHSDFYGELPPQMVQTSSAQHVTGYPPPVHTNYDPGIIPRDAHPQGRPTTTFVQVSPKPNDDDIVSPITPGDALNPADDPATYTWISNPTPPPQSEYSQFSPPPPAHFQSYRPYLGT